MHQATPLWFDAVVIVGIALILGLHVNLKATLTRIETKLWGKK